MWKTATWPLVGSKTAAPSEAPGASGFPQWSVSRWRAWPRISGTRTQTMALPVVLSQASISWESSWPESDVMRRSSPWGRASSNGKNSLSSRMTTGKSSSVASAGRSAPSGPVRSQTVPECRHPASGRVVVAAAGSSAGSGVAKSSPRTSVAGNRPGKRAMAGSLRGPSVHGVPMAPAASVFRAGGAGRVDDLLAYRQAGFPPNTEVSVSRRTPADRCRACNSFGQSSISRIFSAPARPTCVGTEIATSRRP